jgi:hypothetical protein
MAKPLKLASTMPDDEANGLIQLVPTMIQDTQNTLYLVIGVLACEELTTKKFSGEVTPKARWLRLEVISGDEDVENGKLLLQRSNDKRAGRTLVPIQMELDISSIFKDFADGEDGSGQDGAADPG